MFPENIARCAIQMKNAEKMHIKMLYVKLSRIGARNGCVKRKVAISSSGCCVLDEEAPPLALRFPSTERLHLFGTFRASQ